MWTKALLTIMSFLIVLFATVRVRDKFFAQKFLHLVVSVATLLLYYALPKLQFLTLVAIFVFINAFVLPSSIFARKFGVVLYPLAVFIIALFFYENEKVFTLSLYPMFFADPLGALAGRYLGRKKFVCNKTIEGSLIIFLFNILFLLSGEIPFREAILIAFVLALVEAASPAGIDNISVPLVAMAILGGWGSMPLWMTLPVALVVGAIIALAGWLTICGSVAAVALGTLILYAGGFKWVIPLIVFVTLASIFGRILGSGEKSRKATQVYANGGISAIMAVFYAIFHREIFYFMHLSAVASMLADTLATEIGMRFARHSYLITTFRPVRKGTSGGVSEWGFLGALLGASVIASFAGKEFFLPVAMSGFLGSVVDSYLGAIFERRGLWNNDVTNFLAALSGAVIFFFLSGNIGLLFF